MNRQEYFGEKSKIELYADLLLGFLRLVPIKDSHSSQEEYDKEITKKLKFSNITDYKLLRACIDLLEDSQYAILAAKANGLKTNRNHFGEMYLRLYGVLNAAYLQLGATIDLMKLFNIKDFKTKKQILKSCKLIELRNKIGSHSTNYKHNDKEKDFFKVAQSEIDKWGSDMLIVGKDGHEKIDLIENIDSFSTQIEVILEEIVSGVIQNHNFKEDHKAWLMEVYSILKEK